MCEEEVPLKGNTYEEVMEPLSDEENIDESMHESGDEMPDGQ